jgi:phosphoglycolate phosphatase
MPAFATVVFDLDGTLADTLPDILSALNRVMAEEGLRSVSFAEGRTLVGGGARLLMEHALAVTAPALPPEPAIDACYARFLDYYAAEPALRSRPFPEVIEALTALRDAGCRLGVCTNKPHDLTLAVLAGLGLDGFFGDAVLGGDALAVRKPDPRHLRAVIERAGDGAGASVMVGDSETDVAAARNAAVPVVAVSFGYTALAPGELGADLVIDHFGELPAALDRLAATRPRVA